VRDTRSDHYDLEMGYVLVKNPGRKKVNGLIKKIRRKVKAKVE
jgi:hypothetical protein